MALDAFKFFLDSLGLAGQLKGDLRVAALEATLEWARGIRNPGQRSRALLLLHLDLNEPLKSRALRESLEAALRVTDESERRELLKLIGMQLSRVKPKDIQKAWIDDVAMIVRAGDLSPEGSIARRFLRETAGKRGRLLGDIAPRLEEDEIPRYFNLAIDLPDPTGRAFALTGIAPRLAVDVRDEAFRVALEATRGARPQSKSALIRRMGPYLPEGMLGEAFEITLGLPPSWRTGTLAVLAPRLDIVQLEIATRATEEAPRISSASESLIRGEPAPDPVRAALASWLEFAIRVGRPLPERDPRDNPIEQTSVPTDPDAEPVPVGSPPKPPYDGSDRELLSWKSPPARVVSTGFSAVENPTSPLASDQPLLGRQWSFFWLEVGEPVLGAIDKEPSPLPTELLPADAELKVVLFTNEEGFELESRTGVLQLKPKGIEVVKPASVPSGISADDPLLRQRLFFSLRTPEAAGRYQLRCNIYYRQVLVQGRRVNVTVGKAGAIVPEALLTTLDYTLSRSLAAPHLQQIQEHKLSLMMNADGEDSHGFYFHGEGDFNSSARFDGHQVQSLIDRTRRALRAVSWGEEGEWKSDVNQYRYSERPTFDELLPDLLRLARAGYLNYDAIINQLAGGPKGAERLAELMRRPGHLQLALQESARLMVPVALLYDHPLDTQLPADKVRLCPQFKRSSSADSPLEEGVCFLGDCPHREDADVVCPSGFWGFRHSLGIPLTIGADRDSPPDVPGELAYEGFPEVTLAVCTDEQMRERLEHVKHLKALIPSERLHYADTREDTLKSMKETKSHILYFYCHGGRADGVPFIQVGPLSDPGIARDTLRWSRIRWSDPRPLVFINGCHTTDLEPENAIELLSGFIETAGAAAVIGTEITIFEPLAVTFGEHFLRRFLTHGESLGEAVRSARLLLLKGLNPLGLVYLPFGLASLRLKEAESAAKPLAQIA